MSIKRVIALTAILFGAFAAPVFADSDMQDELHATPPSFGDDANPGTSACRWRAPIGRWMEHRPQEAIIGTAEGLIGTNGAQTKLLKPTSSVPLGTPYFYAAASLGDRVVVLGRETGSSVPVELWVTDGTVRATSLVSSFPATANIFNPTQVGTRAVFSYNNGAETGYVSQLWTTDGSVNGTQQIPGVKTPSLGNDSALLSNGKLIFVSADGLEVTDGTPFGTMLLKAHGDGGFKPNQSGSMASLGNIVLFGAVVGGDFENRGGVNQIWRTDGTVNGTAPVISLAGDASNYTLPNFLSFGDKALFNYNSGSVGGFFGVTDGTLMGTTVLPEISSPLDPAISLHHRAIIQTYDGLISTDGTSAGTLLLKEGGTGTAIFYVSQMARLGDEVILAVAHASRPTIPGPTFVGPVNEIWKSDGTAEGTVQIATLQTASSTAGVIGLHSVGTRVLFSYADGANNSILSTNGITVESVLDHANTDVAFAAANVLCNADRALSERFH